MSTQSPPTKHWAYLSAVPLGSCIGAPAPRALFGPVPAWQADRIEQLKGMVTDLAEQHAGITRYARVELLFHDASDFSEEVLPEGDYNRRIYALFPDDDRMVVACEGGALHVDRRTGAVLYRESDLVQGSGWRPVGYRHTPHLLRDAVCVDLRDYRRLFGDPPSVLGINWVGAWDAGGVYVPPDRPTLMEALSKVGSPSWLLSVNLSRTTTQEWQEAFEVALRRHGIDPDSLMALESPDVLQSLSARQLPYLAAVKVAEMMALRERHLNDDVVDAGLSPSGGR